MMMLAFALSHRHVHRWIGGYGRHWLTNFALPRTARTRHVLFAVCDHFEPLWGGASDALGRERVARWADAYPEFVHEFGDGDGLPPCHTFFFPGEQYAPSYLDSLERLASAGL